MTELKPFTTAITVAGAAYFLFNRYLWSWRPLRGWFTSIPDLRGVWDVTLVSSWVNPATGERVLPISAYMMVRQTHSSLTMRLFTKESASVSVAYSIERKDGDLFELVVTYRNTPGIELQATRSRIHYGSLIVEGNGFAPASLRGTYWTDRQTNGTIELSNRRPRDINSYAEGENLPKVQVSQQPA